VFADLPGHALGLRQCTFPDHLPWICPDIAPFYPEGFRHLSRTRQLLKRLLQTSTEGRRLVGFHCKTEVLNAASIKNKAGNVLVCAPRKAAVPISPVEASHTVGRRVSGLCFSRGRVNFPSLRTMR